MRCILGGGDCTRHLATTLTNASYQDAVGIFSRVIQLWLAYIQNRDSPDIPLRGEAYFGDSTLIRGMTSLIPDDSALYRSVTASDSFYIRARGLLFWKIETAQRRTFPVNDRPLHNILNFIITAAKHSMVVRWGMLDAGILALLPLALVDGAVSLLSGLLDAFVQQPKALPPAHKPSSGAEANSQQPDITVIPLTMINIGTSVLARCCQMPQFQELSHSEVFIKRRNICSSLLDTFLGSEHGVGDTYSETRSIFAEILVKRDMRKSGRPSPSGMDISDPYGIPGQH